MAQRKALATIETEALKLLADIKKAERAAVDKLRQFGALLAPVSANPQLYFPADTLKESRSAFSEWYQNTLNVIPFYVNNAIAMAEASKVFPKRDAERLNTGHIKAISPVIRGTADGSTKLLPFKERQANGKAVLKRADEIAKADGTTLRTKDIMQARKELGFMNTSKGPKVTKQGATLDRVVAEINKVDISKLADSTDEQVATIVAFAQNVAQNHENRQHELSEAEANAA